MSLSGSSGSSRMALLSNLRPSRLRHSRVGAAEAPVVELEADMVVAVMRWRRRAPPARVQDAAMRREARMVPRVLVRPRPAKARADGSSSVAVVESNNRKPGVVSSCGRRCPGWRLPMQVLLLYDVYT